MVERTTATTESIIACITTTTNTASEAAWRWQSRAIKRAATAVENEIGHQTGVADGSESTASHASRRDDSEDTGRPRRWYGGLSAVVDYALG